MGWPSRQAAEISDIEVPRGETSVFGERGPTTISTYFFGKELKMEDKVVPFHRRGNFLFFSIPPSFPRDFLALWKEDILRK